MALSICLPPGPRPCIRPKCLERSRMLLPRFRSKSSRLCNFLRRNFLRSDFFRRVGLLLGFAWVGIQLGSEPCQAFETFEKVRAQTVSSEGVLYDRHHEVLQEYRRDPT